MSKIHDLLIIVVLCLCVSSAVAHNCIHDRISHKFQISYSSTETKKIAERSLAQDVYEPIRIVTDYTGRKELLRYSKAINRTKWSFGGPEGLYQH